MREEKSVLGLFPRVDEKATIKKSKFANVYVLNVNSENTAPVVGMIGGENNGIIEECGIVSGVVVNKDYRYK